MLDKLISMFNRFCEAVALYLLGYFNGKDAAEDERLKEENEKLKKGLDAAMRGNYSPDAVRERMRDTKSDK